MTLLAAAGWSAEIGAETARNTVCERFTLGCLFRVIHLDKTVAQAKQLGGKRLVSPRPDLLDGKVAVIANPTGAAVGLLESKPQ